MLRRRPHFDRISSRCKSQPDACEDLGSAQHAERRTTSSPLLYDSDKLAVPDRRLLPQSAPGPAPVRVYTGDVYWMAYQECPSHYLEPEDDHQSWYGFEDTPSDDNVSPQSATQVDKLLPAALQMNTGTTKVEDDHTLKSSKTEAPFDQHTTPSSYAEHSPICTTANLPSPQTVMAYTGCEASLSTGRVRKSEEELEGRAAKRRRV